MVASQLDDLGGDFQRLEAPLLDDEGDELSAEETGPWWRNGRVVGKALIAFALVGTATVGLIVVVSGLTGAVPSPLNPHTQDESHAFHTNYQTMGSLYTPPAKTPAAAATDAILSNSLTDVMNARATAPGPAVHWNYSYDLRSIMPSTHTPLVTRNTSGTWGRAGRTCNVAPAPTSHVNATRVAPSKITGSSNQMAPPAYTNQSFGKNATTASAGENRRGLWKRKASTSRSLESAQGRQLLGSSRRRASPPSPPKVPTFCLGNGCNASPNQNKSKTCAVS